jgi:hypothetical protein
MRDVSMFIAMGSEPDALAQATSWAQKGLDVVNTTRQPHKGKSECDLALVLILFHLGMLQVVSVLFIFKFSH